MLFGKLFKNKNKNVYRLKTMAMVRVVSEVSALALFICLPFVLLLAGLMPGLDLLVKVAVILGSVFSGLMLPAYGFITWQISVSETGLVGWSLIKRRQLAWTQLNRLSRKSNFNWQRYVLDYEGGDITFPLWFERLDELIATIREHLPLDLSPGDVDEGSREFKQDTISFLMQISQVSFGIVLSVVAVYFASDLLSSNKSSIWDSLLVIVFALLLSLSMFWRAIVVALMPRKILIDGNGLQLENIFFKKKIGWNKVEQMNASSPLLPEGYLLETKEGSFLVGSGFDSLDELVEKVRKQIRTPESLT